MAFQIPLFVFYIIIKWHAVKTKIILRLSWGWKHYGSETCSCDNTNSADKEHSFYSSGLWHSSTLWKWLSCTACQKGHEQQVVIPLQYVVIISNLHCAAVGMFAVPSKQTYCFLTHLIMLLIHVCENNGDNSSSNAAYTHSMDEYK